VSDRRIEVELPAISQDQRAQRGHRLGRGENVDDRFSIPGPAVAESLLAAPDVDDHLTVKHNGNGRAHVDSVIEVSREGVRDATEPLIEFAQDLGHRHTLSRFIRSLQPALT
jgi:hypothetical protein